MLRFSPNFRLAAVVAGLVVACGTSTSVTRSWKAPDLKPMHFKKILAVCMCQEPGLERSVEDRLASHMKQAVPAYTVISDDQRRNVDEVRQAVEAAGFDGAVVMQLVGADTQSTYVPGSYYAGPTPYGSMWGYWGYGYGAVYQPGYMTHDQIVSFDTKVYSIADQKLLWASRSQSYNPDKVEQLVDDIVAATVSEMQRNGVVSK
jgi:hypothetical protein